MVVSPSSPVAETGSGGERARRAARSWLFVPADRPRFLAKLPEITADAVVLDLEDGAGDKGEAARANIAAWVGQGAVAVPPALYVRTRGVDQPGFREDVQAAMGPRLAGLVLPKIGSAAQVREAGETTAELAAGAGVPSPALVLIVESAAALEALPAMLAATDRVTAVAFGAEDFSADLGLPPTLGTGNTRSTQGMLDHARARIAVACAAAGITLRIDTPCLAIDDGTGLVSEVERALSFGFTAKFLIHPSQVASLHRALMPTEAEVAWAASLLAAVPDGAGAVRADGRMVDEAVMRQARGLVERVRAGGEQAVERLDDAS